MVEDTVPKVSYKVYNADDLHKYVEERRERLGHEGAERDAEEQGFRRGYHDGYVAAIGQLWDHIEARGAVPVSYRRAYKAAWDFWSKGSLRAWAKTPPPPDDSPLRCTFPPSLDNER